MALIYCPECGRGGVSDSSNACPGCGFNIARKVKNTNSNHNIIVQREWKLLGGDVQMDVFIDGKFHSSIGNGKTTILVISAGK